jgi:arginine utilization regulatory protein
MENYIEKNVTSLNILEETELPLKSIEVLEDICIHVIDKDGRTILYSKGCEEIEHYKKGDILGKHISETYMLNENIDLDDESSLALKVLKTGKPVKDKHMNYLTKRGKVINVISSGYPILIGNEIAGAICVFKDVSQIMEMAATIEKLHDVILLQKKNEYKNGTQFHFQDILGKSSAIKTAIDMAKKISISSSPVLIIGETGTGKELFAQGIHNYCSVSNGPFVAINCSAIPETLLESILFGTSKGAFTGATDKPGIFEEAQNGTLFLDELNSMSLSLQSKLLRVLETKKIRRIGSNKEISINVRIISATNIDPVDAVKKNQFRSDLYYRLAVLTLEVPPLRKRIDDVEELSMSFIESNNKIMGKYVQGISNEAINLLLNYDWPGNVRQLKHAIDYSMSVSEINDIIITPEHLPTYIVKSFKNKEIYNHVEDITYNNLKETMMDIERKIIIEEVKRNNGNLSQSAKKLGISRQHLQYRLKILDIFNLI